MVDQLVEVDQLELWALADPSCQLLSCFSCWHWHSCEASGHPKDHRDPDSCQSSSESWLKAYIQDAVVTLMPDKVLLIFPIMMLDLQLCLSTGVDMKKISNSNNRNGMFHWSFVFTAVVLDSRTKDRIVGWQNYLKLRWKRSWDSWLPLKRFCCASGTYNTSCKIRLTRSPWAVMTVILQSPIPIACKVSPSLAIELEMLHFFINTNFVESLYKWRDAPESSLSRHQSKQKSWSATGRWPRLPQDQEPIIMLVLQKWFHCVLRHKWRYRYTMFCQQHIASVDVTARSDARSLSTALK